MGRRITTAELAHHVDDLAGRLSAAGVRSGEHVAIYKVANFDVWLLATAAARVGAVPVMLSPALDPRTVGILMERLGQPHLLTDAPKLEPMSAIPVADLATRSSSWPATARGRCRWPVSPGRRRFHRCSTGRTRPR